MKHFITVIIILIFSCDNLKEDSNTLSLDIKSEILSPEQGKHYIGDLYITLQIDSNSYNDNSIYFQYGIEGITKSNNTGLVRVDNYKIRSYHNLYKNVYPDGKYTIIITAMKGEYGPGPERRSLFWVDSISFYINNSSLGSIKTKSVSSNNGRAVIEWEKSTTKSFRFYKIERSKNEKFDYEEIAYITDVNTTKFEDNSTENLFGTNIYFYRVLVSNTYERIRSNELPYSYGSILDFKLSRNGKFSQVKNNYYFPEPRKNKIFVINSLGMISQSNLNINSLDNVFLIENDNEIIAVTASNALFFKSDDLSYQSSMNIRTGSDLHSVIDNFNRIVVVHGSQISLYNKKTKELLNSFETITRYHPLVSFITNNKFVVIPLSVLNSSIRTFDISNDTIKLISEISLENIGYKSSFYHSKSKILFTTNRNNIFKMEIGSETKFSKVNGLNIPAKYYIKDVQVTDDHILLQLTGNHDELFKTMLLKLSKNEKKEIQRYSCREYLDDFYMSNDGKHIFATIGSETYKIL